MTDILVRSAVHAFVDLIFLPLNVWVLMMVTRTNAYAYLDLPRPSWKQAFGLALVVMILA